MFKAFDAGSIGIKADWPEQLRLASAHGFDGLTVSMPAIVEMGAAKAADDLAAAELKPASWGLTVNYRKDEETFASGLKDLGRHAAAAAEIGCSRCCTWVLSFSDELAFEDNTKLHVDRLGACARVLADAGVALGLEFLGPKTIRAKHAHEFVHTIDGMLELCARIGTGNAGLLLDAWHWYTSGDTVERLKRLKPEDVVHVHVNDAPAGVPLDEHVDNKRAMPGETGVIDIAGFLGALSSIGYDGPVQAEPFSQRVKELSPDEAAAETAASLSKIWGLAGLA